MYASVKPAMEKLLADMEYMRRELDRPPYDNPAGPSASLSEALEYAVSRAHPLAGAHKEDPQD